MLKHRYFGTIVPELLNPVQDFKMHFLIIYVLI